MPYLREPPANLAESLARSVDYEALGIADSQRLGICAAPSGKRRRHRPRSATPDGLRTLDEAAARLRCSIKTLKGHVTTGELKYVTIGHGNKHVRRMFTDADLNAFITTRTREDSPCPLPASRARHTGTSISKCAVIDFGGPRKPPTGAKPKN